jgi:hypothetical protein
MIAIVIISSINPKPVGHRRSQPLTERLRSTMIPLHRPVDDTLEPTGTDCATQADARRPVEFSG